MEQIIIHCADGTARPLCNRAMATTITSAKQTREINNGDTVSMTITSTNPQTFNIGDWIEVFGRIYKLNRLPKVKKDGALKYTYTLDFEGIQYDLLRAMYNVNIDTTNNHIQDVTGDALTGNLKRFMDVLIANANRVFPGTPPVWSLGTYPEETDGDVTMSFGESDNCLAVLQSICEKFKTEFDITTTDGVHFVINLGKVGQQMPTPFRYGKGGGLYTIERQNVSSSNVITRLFAYGSTENITCKYRSTRLLLPGANKAQSFIEHADAKALYGVCEAIKYFDDIKPTYKGVVTGIVADDVLSFKDNNFPFDINEKDADGVTTKYLIDGMAAKIHFNSGNLAGFEFEIHKYDHATKTFTLVKETDERGNVFPSPSSTAFQIQPGDTYKIIDVAYPEDITNAAEIRLMETATEYLEQNCQPKVQYSVNVTREWLTRRDMHTEGVTEHFTPGDYIRIIDEGIGVDKYIRIRTVERDILDPYTYALTISDTVTISVVNRLISDEIAIDKIININDLRNPARAAANWRSSREVLNMVFDTEGDYYTDKIKPQSIDTLMLSVGAKSMQFGLVGVTIDANYQGNPNVFHVSGGSLVHYAIEEQPRTWTMGATTVANLTPADAYYIYAQVSRNGDDGRWALSKEQIAYDANATMWTFLVGVLNSVDAGTGVRGIYTMYGFTTINGRFIRTGRIESSGGSDSYFDLDNGSMQLGDKLDFNKNGDGRLVLRGTIVQSTSGDEFPASCFRGEYVPGASYYPGDVVTYASNGGTSSYMCVVACTNIVPTNTNYWTLYASQGGKGDKGDKGDPGKNGIDGLSPNTAFKSVVFMRTNGTPATPSGGSYTNPVPSGWSDGVPSGEAKLWMSTRVFSSDGKDPQQSTWTAPRQMTDTADLDVEFSSVANPNPPTGHPNTNTQWSNESNEETIWMATSKKANGVWMDWQISKIKGESGEDGTSINVKGSVHGIFATRADFTAASLPRGYYYLIDHDEELDANCVVAYHTNRMLVGVGYRDTFTPAAEGDAWVYDDDGHLYLANTDEGWADIGQFKGDTGAKGDPGSNAYVHIKYANSLTTNDWTSNNGETPGAYIGIYTDNNPVDALDWSKYTWKKWQGEDGYGYEYIYKLTASATAPDTPTDAANQNPDYVPTGWNDNPPSVTASNPYCWVAYRKKVDGLWGNFIGSAENPAKAALWAKFGADGVDGAQGDPGAPGNYTEYRFAVNGSTLIAPSFTVSPTGDPTVYTTTQPRLLTGQYLWMIYAVRNGETRRLVQPWSTPVRVNGAKGADGADGENGRDGVDGKDGKDGTNGKDGKDGKDGINGSSPAMVFRGDYSASKTYYGTSVRIDCVRYNGAYYIARTDAPNGAFSGIVPTNGNYWNPFGASFESVATELLLAENAQIAGWIFRNGRLESQSGNTYLNGVTGEMRLKGMLQQSTAYSGNISDSNLFYLPAKTTQTSLSMGHEEEDIGKVCRLFNSSPLGGASYIIACQTFSITKQPGMTTIDATLGTVYVRIDPQEFVTLTCFEMPPGNANIKGTWQLTGRMATENWRRDEARGRFPRMHAMGRMNYTSSGNAVSLSGKMWNGQNISSVMTVKRNGTGNYTISFNSSLLPTDYKVMCVGYGSTNKDARVASITSTSFQICCSDDDSLNDSSFDFWIFDPNWWYDLQ